MSDLFIFSKSSKNSLLWEMKVGYLFSVKFEVILIFLSSFGIEILLSLFSAFCLDFESLFSICVLYFSFSISSFSLNSKSLLLLKSISFFEYKKSKTNR